MIKSPVTKVILGVSMMMAFSAAFAGPDKSPAKFEEKKAAKLAEIDKHISKMQEHRGCVAAAADHDAMKKCHEAMKSFHDEMRKEHEAKMGGKKGSDDHAHHE